MKKWMLCICVLVLVRDAGAQPPDTVKTNERKVQWLVGADALSALNFVSVIGGAETNNRSRYSFSFSSLFGSTRFGAYYDVCVSKSYGFWLGLGYHNSFKFKDFNVSRQNYVDSLIRNDIERSTSTISFQPDYGETRWQQFISFSIMKEFKIYKKLFFSFRVMAVYGYNPYYKHGEFYPNGGVQLYAKL